MLYKMIATEGIRSCFKGNGANSIRIAVYLFLINKPLLFNYYEN